VKAKYAVTLMFNNATYTYTIPIFVNNKATEAMPLNNCDMGCTKHIECCALLHHSHHQARLMMLYFVNGKPHNIANVGTKVYPSERNCKLSIIKHPIAEETIIMHTT
jgi:hypothetical protein